MVLISQPLHALRGIAVAALFISCAATATAAQPAASKVSGYLGRSALPDSLALLPPPPAPGSAGFALDEQVNREGRALRGTSRFAQAAADAARGLPSGANQFSCAIDVDVDEVKTPALYRLLDRSRVDAGAVTGAAKKHYQRARPFMVNLEPTCTPRNEASLRKSGSYPSGHTSTGWTWALILAEIAPESAEAILQRGRSYGESRLICNVHWQSDILAGRFLGAAVVANLHANADFQRDLQEARKEISAAHARGDFSRRDCAAEEAVLKIRPPSAL